MRLTYKEAGVDIEKGERFVDVIKKKLKDREKANIGLFGGLYDLGHLKYKNPVLVSSTDGVGTKLLLAKEANNYKTIGIDLVAMCVNDIITSGAKPLFFLDYMATAKLDINKASEIIDGILKGLKDAECTLLGGETAEMPGVYQKDDYELAGFCVGIVEKDNIIDGKSIEKGDVLVGIKSSGIHSNGLTLARKALFEKKGYSYDYKHKLLSYYLINELLIPTRIYVKLILNTIRSIKVKGIAHITGGGIVGNVKRLLRKDLKLKIFWDNIKPQKIFDIIQDAGNIPIEDMRNTFNMGTGLVLVVGKNDKEKLFRFLKENDESPVLIGEVMCK